MANVTAALRDAAGVPLRRTFVEHLGPFDISLGWRLTDRNGSFTFDAGLGFNRVDVRVHCRNSVMRIVDDSDSIPGTSHIKVKMNVGNGETAQVGSFPNHFRVLTQAQDVYDTVWRQFSPYNGSGRRDFPLRRRPSVLDTFANSATCETSFPSKFPLATLTFVEPVGVFNNAMPILHLRQESRLFGGGGADPSLMPHELGHVFHFAALRPSSRTSLEVGYLSHLTAMVATGGSVTHDFRSTTNPLVAFVEAVGIFSERFFFFKKRVAPNLSGLALRIAFLRDELSNAPSLPGVLLGAYHQAGRLSGNGVVKPRVTTDSVEGAVYGAIYLDLAQRIGLHHTMRLVFESNATNFGELQAHVQGRGRADWANAIDAVAQTWM